MAEKKKVNYRSGLEILLKNKFHSEKLDTSGLKLISELLNEVNSLLIYHIETEYSSVDKINGQTFEHCARKAIDENFPGDLKANALSEAHKQLALLESGCLVYGKDAKKVKGKTENHEDAELKKLEVPIRLFKKGIGKMLSAMFPSLKVDSRALEPLALNLHAFSEMAAKRASEIAGQREELLPADLKEALPEYLENSALKVALGEANRCLVLYEKGLIKFGPNERCESCLPEENKVSERIVPKAFEPGIKKLLSEIGPGYDIDAKSKRYLAHILTDLAQYIAENTSETCQKKNALEIKDGDIHQSIGATFPRELKQHTQVNCSKDVMAFQSGIVPYERSTVRKKKRAKVKKSSPKPRQKTVSKKGRKSSTISKKRKTSKTSKRSPSPKKRRSKSPTKGKTPSKEAKAKKSSPKPSLKSPVTVSKKRKSSKTPKQSPPSKKRRLKSPPKDKKPSQKITGKGKFAGSIISTALEVFSDINISLTKETEVKSFEVLEDVCNALINTCVSRSTNSKEMDIEDFKGALEEFFPPELAKHALSTALNSVSKFRHEKHSLS